MKKARWICSPQNSEGEALSFTSNFSIEKDMKNAVVEISSIGVYQATLNSEKISNQVLTPGFTSYRNRVQYQTFDITSMLKQHKNELNITVAPGWAVGHIGYDGGKKVFFDHLSAIAHINISYKDGTNDTFYTDENWEVYSSVVRYADIYNGETNDTTYVPQSLGNAIFDDVKTELIAQAGEDITEQERISPIELILTPNGERVIDFGQNLTGYVEFKIKGSHGEKIVITHAEVLDKEGNFYNANYRAAQNKVTFVLNGENQILKPQFSFQGFRYIRLDEYPDIPVNLSDIYAVAVHSNMERTGYFYCENKKINQLYHNIVWGQKGNYLDIPTDCPQRNERLGWTGDAQVFCRTAAMNFDVRKFFEKWLGDLRIEQRDDGAVWGVCPEAYSKPTRHSRISAAWGDVATVIPWELYCAYGDKQILSDNFTMMKRWVDYLHGTGPQEFLWLGGYHYGDWLAMDAGEDSYVGATSNDLIASAFFAHSTDLLIRAGEVLGKDMAMYKDLYKNIISAFRAYFMENGMPKEEFPLTEIKTEKQGVVDTVRKGMTQTAIVLILHFNLCLPEERQALADKLEELIHQFGDRMTTGFVGTPYILHVLSDCGKTDLAFKLLLQEKNPSWLYSVNKGATTMWEHWNGIKEDGTFWSTAMNSFNHYAYGAVGDWLYGVVAGIQVKNGGEGYKNIRIAPHPDHNIGFVNCTLNTVSGKIESHHYYKDNRIFFEFTVPNGVNAEIVLPDKQQYVVKGGTYHYSIYVK